MKWREPLHSQCLVSRPPAWSGRLCHTSCVVPGRDALQPVQTMEGRTIQRLPLGLWGVFLLLFHALFLLLLFFAHDRQDVAIPVGIALTLHAHASF